ncbi:MAG: MBG domain-containing protein, partial [Oscillospiraceae bacterium]
RAVVTDGTVSCAYSKNGNAGTYDIIPSGFSADNYTIQHKNGTLTVKEKTGTLSAKFANPDAEYYYTGDAYTPAVIVTDGETVLTENVDYKLEYSDNIKAGTAAVTITFKGNYSGSETLNFTIKQSGFTPVLKTADKTYGENDAVAWLENVPDGAGAVTLYYAKADSDVYSATVPTDAGEYKVYAVIADSDDYVGVTTADETFTINKRRITITANSAVFSYDGNPHSDSGYEMEGTFVVGQGFKDVTVTGSVTDVTEPDGGVENVITYELSSTTNANNYEIITVNGLLQVVSLALTVPSGLGWSSVAGTASWVPVKKNNLIVNYALNLYAFDGTNYIQINAEPIITENSYYDFAPAIIEHASAEAANGNIYSYTFKIQTLSAGGTGQQGYTDSVVSDYQKMMYIAEVSIDSDGSTISSASLDSEERLIVLNGQKVSVSAKTKDGFVFADPALTATSGFTLSTPVIQTPDAHKESTLTATLTATLSASQLGGVVSVHAVDEAPWISSFTAEN